MSAARGVPELPVTSYALLGLLTFDNDLTGYELKQRADLTLRFYWTAPAMSQVYTELTRLAELALVRPLGNVDKPRTTRYRITAKGRRTLVTWMRETPAGFPVLKHPIALRLLIAHLSDAQTTRQMLVDYLAEISANRRDLAEVRRSLDGAAGPGEILHFPSFVADWGLAYFDSEARIAKRMLKRLDDDAAGD